jgi:hypothetical protein
MPAIWGICVMSAVTSPTPVKLPFNAGRKFTTPRFAVDSISDLLTDGRLGRKRNTRE